MLGCEPVHILNNQLVPSATFHRIHGLGEPSSLGSFLCHGGFQCFAVQGGGHGWDLETWATCQGASCSIRTCWWPHNQVIQLSYHKHMQSCLTCSIDLFVNIICILPTFGIAGLQITRSIEAHQLGQHWLPLLDLCHPCHLLGKQQELVHHQWHLHIPAGGIMLSFHHRCNHLRTPNNIAAPPHCLLEYMCVCVC